MPSCVAVARLIRALVCVSRRRQHGSRRPWLRCCTWPEGPRCGRKMCRCCGRRPESSGRAAGVARSRATGSRAVAPGTEVVEGALFSWRHQVRCDARVSGRGSTSRDASAATLDVESGTR